MPRKAVRSRSPQSTQKAPGISIPTRAPAPSTQRPPLATATSNSHQPLYFQPAHIAHNYQQHAGFTFDPAVAAYNDLQAAAERERLAAQSKALHADNPYEDLLVLGINPDFFSIAQPAAT